jgi:Na+-driven multidrug efflux pump
MIGPTRILFDEMPGQKGGCHLNGKIGTSLLVFFCFLSWLFFSIYLSSGEEWWSVLKTEQSSSDTSAYSVSFIRVMIGSMTFFFVAVLLYTTIKKLK